MQSKNEITPEIALAIRDITVQLWSTSITVPLLAKKFGFDAEEGHRFLTTSIDYQVAEQVGKLYKQRRDAERAHVAAPKKVATKKVPKPDDKPKIKRGKSGYLLYADHVRKDVRASLDSQLLAGQKLQPYELVRAVGAKWKAEDQAVRDMWNERAVLHNEDSIMLDVRHEEA